MDYSEKRGTSFLQIRFHPLFIHLWSLPAIVMVIAKCQSPGRCAILHASYIIMLFKIFWRSFRQSS